MAALVWTLYFGFSCCVGVGSGETKIILLAGTSLAIKTFESQ